MLVASAGTGGTITGIARKLKEKCPGCKVSALGRPGVGVGVRALPGSEESSNQGTGVGVHSAAPRITMNLQEFRLGSCICPIGARRGQALDLELRGLGWGS